MSDTIEYDLTGNYGLKKPWLDADDDVWGQHLNENMDLIDNLLVTRGFDASKYLLLTGGEITGDLSVLGALSTGGPVVTTGTGPALVGASTGAGIVLNNSTSNRLAGTLNIDGLTVGALLTVTATGVAVAAPQFTVDAPSLIELNGPVGSVFLGPDANTLGGDWHVGGMLTLSANPVNPLDAATRGYVDATVGSYLPLVGGEISGDVQIDGKLRVGATVDAGYKFDLAGTARINLPVAAMGVSPLLITNGATVPSGVIHPNALGLVIGAGTSGAAWQLVTIGATAPTFIGANASGVPGALLAVTANKNLFGLWAEGFDGTNWGYAANIFMQSSEAWTATAHGTAILFGGTSNGSTALLEWARFTNGNLLIGSATNAGYKLDVRGVGRFDSYTGTGLLPAGTSTVLWLGAPDATALSLNIAGYGTSATPRLGGYFANGTRLAPTAALSGNTLFAINSLGYGATDFASNSRATVSMVAGENWTDAAQGAAITFRTTPNTTIATAEAMRIQASGNLSIGSTTDAGFKLDVIGTGRFSGLLSLNGGLTVNTGLATLSAGAAITGTVTINGALNLTGGGLTAGTNTTAQAIWTNGPAAAPRILSWRTAGVARWVMSANATAEGGGNAGSDLDISGYTDAGALIANAIRITRSNSNVALAGSIGVNGTAPPAKPTVTGAKAGNTALASLCAALVSYGLIADTSSA